MMYWWKLSRFIHHWISERFSERWQGSRSSGYRNLLSQFMRNRLIFIEVWWIMNFCHFVVIQWAAVKTFFLLQLHQILVPSDPQKVLKQMSTELINFQASFWIFANNFWIKTLVESFSWQFGAHQLQSVNIFLGPDLTLLPLPFLH